MCVTNTTSRRNTQQQPVSLGAAANLSESIRQSFVSPYTSTAAAKPQQQPVYGGFPTFSTAVPQQYVQIPAEKPRPKRRRKPQKPGKTAKLNDRHFVHHNYHDHSHDAPVDTQVAQGERRKGGVSIPFPVKLHSVLDQVEADGLAHIVSWQPHGRCFVIHKPKEFVDHVMPKYFRQTKLTSFQRQLNLYGFSRLTRGPDATGYYHELFLRGKVFLCKQMTRTKVKGTKFKAASSPEEEPDFYTMPPLIPSVTSDEDMSHESEQHSYDRSHYEQPVQPQVSSFEPLPYEYRPFAAAMAPPAAAAYACDRVLDEAVEELFMDIPSDSADPLDDFVSDWVPADNTFAQSLENDAALGFMLEKLLEE
mmetsp:Transcript_1546/g.3434  ORF Transcript_1546/g.3434 Transcript_1546/m.3434 type:complete len:363 (+) Transcript_1546:55-1143(+)|eukprot:scaffold15224_cov181-Amphora_coffeaeformis.AAC.2